MPLLKIPFEDGPITRTTITVEDMVDFQIFRKFARTLFNAFVEVQTACADNKWRKHVTVNSVDIVRDWELPENPRTKKNLPGTDNKYGKEIYLDPEAAVACDLRGWSLLVQMFGQLSNSDNDQDGCEFCRANPGLKVYGTCATLRDWPKKQLPFFATEVKDRAEKCSNEFYNMA